MPPEIQDGNLVHFAPDALAARQAMREVCLVAGGAVGFGSTGKHFPMLPVKQGVKPEKVEYYGTTKRF